MRTLLLVAIIFIGSCSVQNPETQTIDLTGEVVGVYEKGLLFESEDEVYEVIMDSVRIKIRSGTVTITVENRNGNYYLVM